MAGPESLWWGVGVGGRVAVEVEVHLSVVCDSLTLPFPLPYKP